MAGLARSGRMRPMSERHRPLSRDHFPLFRTLHTRWMDNDV